MDKLISHLLEKGIYLFKDGDKLNIEYNGDSISDDLVEEIRNNKDQLLRYLSRENVNADYQDIVPVQLSESYPLSSAQKRLWILDQFKDGAVAYSILGDLYWNHAIDLQSFKKAIDATINRHEILRTVFKTDAAGEVRQWILNPEKLGFELDYRDLRGKQDAQGLVRDYIQTDSRKTFDLENGPLLRAALLQLEDDAFVFYFNMHHIISDGWSMDVLSRDVFSFYDAFRAGKEPRLTPLKIQYKDYSVWQQARLEKPALKAHRNYWLNKLSGELPVLDLPGTKPRPRLKTYNGRALGTYLDKALYQELKAYCQKQGGTVFMGVLASLNALLYRYTGQTDSITGSAVAGREHADLENQIGFYINTLALRNELKPEDTFQDLFLRVKENTLQAYTHQMYPFDRLVEELNLQRDTSRSAVFDLMLVFQNNGEKVQGPELDARELSLVTDLGERISKFDLDISVQEKGDYLFLQLVYNTDIYSREMLETLLSHYRSLLGKLLQQPMEKLALAEYLSGEEKRELLFKFNDTGMEYSRQKTVLDLFAEQVERTPDSSALICGGKTWTYRQLDERSSQLADYLQKNYAIQPDDLVGIRLERSEWMIVSLLGVLKSGGAYVPLDPAYPKLRLEFIEKETNYKVCLDEQELTTFRNSQEKYAAEKKVSSAGGNHLAYVIYTSGTTGIPKGVMIEHSALTNYLLGAVSVYAREQAAKMDFGLFSSLTFDLVVSSIYLPLITGGTLTVFDPLEDAAEILRAYAASGIACIKLTPAHISLLKDLDISAAAIRLAIVGGEKLEPRHIEILRSLNPAMKIYNEYGPTETTVGCIVKEIGEYEEEIQIGRPMANTRIYILGAEGQLMPKGATGEICIAGDGLARGYLNREQLTREKFRISPFDGKRLYRTGDLGRWCQDGNIVFTGRKDEQVKIRGYRIEPAEIEQVLLKHEQVKEALVMAKENRQKEKELVAYIVSSGQQKPGDLTAYLKEYLPEYMIPSFYVQLETFPLTAHGKIDRNALPDPETMGFKGEIEYQAPRNETEKILTEIWSQVLQRSPVGIQDDFFTLGGHSLKAIRLSNEYHKKLGVKLSLKELFAHTSIKAQAELIHAADRTALVQIGNVPLQKNYAISDAQRRIWVLSQFEGGSAAYNMSGDMYLNHAVDIECFGKAINAVIKRHEILRTVFKADENGQIRQWVQSSDGADLKVEYKDLRKQENGLEQARAYVSNDAHQPFDLVKGPLLRAALLQLEDKVFIFYYNMHHIISDGWSMEVLARDVFSYYEAYRENKSPALEPLRMQYKDYSAWQLAQLSQEAFKAHRNYWLNNLSGELPLIDLLVTKQRPRIKTYNGRTLGTYLNKDLSRRLKDFSLQQGGTVFMGLLASLNAILQRYTGHHDLIVGSPVAGREHADLEHQIGFYVNTLALRNEVRPGDNFRTLFAKVKQNTLNAYAHQMYPFDRLVEELDLVRDTSRSAVFDIMLVLQNNGETITDFELQEDEADRIVDRGFKTSKFDVLISVREEGEYFSFLLEYNTDVYEKESMERFIVHYKQLLSGLLADTQQPLHALHYLTQEEQEELLNGFNATDCAYSDVTVMELFEAQVKRSPDAPALQFGEETLSYGELNARSNVLAHLLRDQYGVSSSDRVGVMLERSPESAICMIGLMKTGACYVPVDHEYPSERVRYITEDSGIKLMISTGKLGSKHGFKPEQLFLIEAHDPGKGNKENPLRTNALSDGSYVIYTSGSTGQPKGVLQTHRMLSNLIQWDIHHSGIAPGLKHLQYASFSFDASLHDLYFVLGSGGSAYIVKESQRLDYPALKAAILNQKIAVLSMPFSALNAFCTETEIEHWQSGDIRYIVSTAEQLYVGQGLRTFLDRHPGVELHNHYGPSESHVISSHRMSSGQSNLEVRSPIGKPLSNSRIYILDGQRHLVPVGVEGELYLGGHNLAIGYLNKEELTQERFVEDPFRAGELLYKTGDQGYWRKDGTLVFTGRKDDQVKIRGYRIELGEIEHALQSHEEIEEAVVLAKDNPREEKELVAYLRSRKLQNSTELRGYLKQILPEYMLPLHYVQLDSFPLTGNGKIDKRSLPAPKGLGLSSGIEYIAPRTETEKKLVEIWEMVLQKEHIGIKDDFFELGGYSIMAMGLVAEYNKSFNVRFQLQDIYERTHLYEHAELIEIRDWVRTDPEQEMPKEENVETFDF